jgi:hypothetical protein
MPQAPPTLRVLSGDLLVYLRGAADVSLRSSLRPVDPACGSIVRRPADIFHPPR